MIYPVEIKNLIKDYKTLRAVGDVSFQVNSGEIFGLLGPNGAGKTTIISTMSTLEKPTSGEVKIFGTDVTKEPKKAKTLKRIWGLCRKKLFNRAFLVSKKF